MTYEVDGEQYIAVLSGWGSAFALQDGQVAAQSGNPRNISRVLAFKLGGTLSLPPLEPRRLTINPPPKPADAASVAHGEAVSNRAPATGVSDAAPPLMDRSRRHPRNSAGLPEQPLPDAMVDCLRLGVRFHSQHPHQQITAAAVNLHNFGMVPKFPMADHESAV